MLCLLCFPGLTNFVQAEGVTIVGRVDYLGKIPLEKIVQVTKDPDYCGKTQTIPSVQVSLENKGLQEAVVSLHTTRESELLRPPSTSKMANRDCLFLPDTLAMMRGDSIEIQNQDPILHNTHIKLKKRTILNVAQLSNSSPVAKRLKRVGVHNIRCDKHRFMEATLHVFAHPWFSVTNRQGAFQILNVPPGPQTIQVWHETLGILEKEVIIPPKGTISVNFEYPKTLIK